MEVKLYITDPNTNSSLSLSSNLINSQLISSTDSLVDADHNYLEFEFEMVTLEATDTDDYGSIYTSLKDISPPPGLGMSRKESWREVPLKDPLVQHAAWAWAYLPLSNMEHQRTGFFRKFKDGFVGCFKNVILAIAGKLLPDQYYDIDDQVISTRDNIVDLKRVRERFQQDPRDPS